VKSLAFFTRATTRSHEAGDLMVAGDWAGAGVHPRRRDCSGVPGALKWGFDRDDRP
jgi:hypothetical protein